RHRGTSSLTVLRRADAWYHPPRPKRGRPSPRLPEGDDVDEHAEQDEDDAQHDGELVEARLDATAAAVGRAVTTEGGAEARAPRLHEHGGDEADGDEDERQEQDEVYHGRDRAPEGDAGRRIAGGALTPLLRLRAGSAPSCPRPAGCRPTP